MAVKSTAALVARLALFEAALEAVLAGQSYSIDGRTLTRASAQWITDQIAQLESRIASRSRSASVSVAFRSRA